MMECVKEFVDSAVLEAVQQRTDKVKIARRAKVEEMMAMEMEVLKEMKEAAAAAAVVRRRVFVDIAGSQPSCVRLCNHVGCTRSVHVRVY